MFKDLLQVKFWIGIGLILLSCSTYAVNYTLPSGASSLPGSCSASGGNVTCTGNVSFGNNDTITLTQNVAWLISGNFSFGNNFEANNSGSNTLTLTVAGNLEPSNNAQIKANLTVSGNITTATNGNYNGNIVVTGNVTLGNNTSVTGNIQASSVTIAQNVTVNGNITAQDVSVSGGNSVINGNINATGNVTISGTVNGYVNAPCGGSNSCGGIITQQCDQNSNVGACSGGGVRIAKFSMEQTGWSGSGSILDTSGNSNNGTPLGGVNPVFTDPQVSCKVAQIPANTTHTALTAVDTGVDVNTLGSQGSIAFWYRSNQAWNQVAVDTRKMLFDASAGQGRRFSLYLSGISSHEGRLVFHGSEGDNDNIYLQSDTQFSFDNNTWVHIAVTWDATADRVKLYINGSEENLTQVVTNTAFDEGLADLGTLIFGDAKNADYSQTGGTPHPGNAADGYIDEIQLFNYELSSSQVNTARNDVSTCTLPPPQALAKYELSQIGFSGNNSILDTSGNNNHASPVGNLASILPNPQKSCRAGDIPFNDSTSSSAIDTQLDLDSDIGSRGTIAFWYKSDTAWANGADRKLIDASNYTGQLISSKAFYGTLTSAGRIEFGLEGNNDNDLVVQTAVQSYGADQWVHIAFTWNIADQELEIYLDGTKQTLSFIHNQGITSPLIDLNTLYIGDNRDTYDSFESNTNNSANGVFDEIYIYDGVISNTAINTIKDAVTDCVCSVNGLTGFYYNGYTNSNAAFPTGTPALTRVDNNVAFNWGGGSPGSGVSSDDFAVAWQGTVQAPVTGSVTFSTLTDDGVRLWVDGQLLIDDWRDKSPNRVTATAISLTAGQHYSIRMEYYENGGGAVAQLEWQYSGQSRQPIPNQYLFACNGPVVSSVVLQCNQYDRFTVNFDVIGNANISNAELQNLSRYVLKDSGGNTINLSSATAQSSTSVQINTATTLTQDNAYTLTVTDLEDTDGNKVAPNPTNFQFTAAALGLTGSYYNGYNRVDPFPTGTPVLTRTDSIVDFNWGTGNPGGGINNNNFAVAWAGQVVAPVTGNYTFSTVTDDGVRLFLDENQNNNFEISAGVNNERIIDRWVLQGATRRTATRTVFLTAGSRYNIRMEYFENGGFASAQLEWQYPGQSRQIIPTQYLRPVCQTTQVDHYRLEHPTNGYTCADTQVTIKACADSSCSSLYNQASSLTLTTDNGTWLNGTNLNFTGSVNKSLRNLTTNTATIGATSPSPNAAVRCYIGGTQSNCQISYAEAELVSSWENDTDPVTSIPTQISQLAFDKKLVVRTSNLASCGAALQNKALQIAVECSNPTSCNNNMFRVDGTQLVDPTTFYTVPGVTFDANGKVEIPANILRYDDAGQIQLKFRDIDTGNISRASGTSNNFVVKPDKLLLDHSVHPTETASDTFNWSLTAVGRIGNTTPNYQSQQLDIALQKNGPVTPVSLTYKGSINASYTDTNNSNSTFSMDVEDNLNFPATSKFVVQPKFDSGVASLNMSYSEVGLISFDFQERNYLGAGVISTEMSQVAINNSKSKQLRFVPAYFDLQVTPNFTAACNNFTYFGQNFNSSNGSADARTQVVFTARNRAGNETRYYDSSGVTNSAFMFLISTFNTANARNYFDRPQPGATARTVNEVLDDGTLLNNTHENFDGSFTVLLGANERFSYKKEDTPEAPLTGFSVGLGMVSASLMDQDNIGYSQNSGTSYIDYTLPLAVNMAEHINGNLRWGRIVLDNVYGPENESLRMPVRTEFALSSTQFTANTDDNCTSYNLDESANQIVVSPSGNNDLTNSIANLTGVGQLNMGRSLSFEGILIPAPSPAQAGSIGVRLEPTTSDWDDFLNFDWNSDNVIDQNDRPSATATFGQFRGNDRIIHWREVFNE